VGGEMSEEAKKDNLKQ
jgi:mitogen-activated protein kinase 1/3